MLVLINASMTSVRCRNMVVEPIIALFARGIGEGFVLIDDNTRRHRARIVNGLTSLFNRHELGGDVKAN